MIRTVICAAVLLLGTATFAADKKVDFEKEIWPILHDKCVKCHRAPYKKGTRTKKPKGDLRLDDAKLLMQGGEGGACVEPGKPDKSSLYKLCLLPPDHDDVMPPEGKADPLTDKEKGLLKRWIEEGANFGSWTKGEYKGE